MITKLIVASGKSAGRSIAIKRTKLLIGRAEECDVRPLSEEVSRRHCAVVVGPADVWIEDLGSRNGTFVNGTQIQGRTKLADGDMIRVGSLELRVSCQSQAAAAKGGGEDVSHWSGDDADAASADTTRTMAAVMPDAKDGGDGSFVSGIESAPPAAADDSSPRSSGSFSLQELKAAAKEKPGTLPQTAAKKSDSSRDAAAEALKKFFERK